ncbi:MULTISPECIES: acylphosphatase [unclassified Methylobacterium]|uniref:acylphosphatase n=1 Tax=unclassified Methylobacterium TaxID=2615210 RepID=UPI0010D45865|nr:MULTISPECIES: acylphosphatase [unclassified Methylobacterium]QEE42803.1 acylphosphatase [Methylobacterium sp. WL1]RYY17368.1 MAG: acylphosphatase [Alphaproteobacteria bacterium]TXN58681.1 acylphosphatase [Methylobacterium sp. WL2]
MSVTCTVSVIVKGRVQGVSYRAWTQAEARALDLTGFVRNRADGSVEAVFCGAPDAVDRMIALCRSGPPHARVSEVIVQEGGDPPETHGFDILRG